MTFTTEAEFAIAEMQSIVESLWRTRDWAPEMVSIQELLTIQREANDYLAQWAHAHDMACVLPEERADALLALRRKNADTLTKETYQ